MLKLLNLINSTQILDVLSWLDEIGNDILEIILAPITTLLWGLCDIFFIILNMFESIFREIAGLGDVHADGTDAQGDIVLYLIQSDIVQQVFFSILILSLFLLIIFTIMAIVKNQYSDKQEPVGKIVGNSCKALLMYLLVPVATVVCLMVGNVVLQAVDGATKPSSKSSASDMLFICGAYNANPLRDSRIEDATHSLATGWYTIYAPVVSEITAKTGLTFSGNVLTDEFNRTVTRQDLDIAANIVDVAFVEGRLITVMEQYGYFAVSSYYDIIGMSFITIWVGGFFLIKAIGTISWGLISRMFKMTLYFAISPAVMATFPIDGGKALGSWRGEMVKLGSMTIVTVGVMNVLYTVLPFINSIDLFGALSGIAKSIFKLLITIIAFSSIKDLVSGISGWFGATSAFAEGEAAKKAGTEPIKKAAGKAVGMFGGIVGGMKAAEKHDGNKWAGAFMGALSQTPLGSATNAYFEAFDKGSKAGDERYKRSRTHRAFGFLGEDDQKKAQYEAYDEREKKKKQYEAMGGREGAYNFARDDGTDAETVRRRKWLAKSSDVGDALYEQQVNENKDAQEIAEREKGFLDVINEWAKARRSELSAKDKLHREFTALGLDSSKWANEQQRETEIQRALREGVKRVGANGQIEEVSTETLRALFDDLNEKSKNVTSAKKTIDSRRRTDTKFANYVSNGGAAAFAVAQSGSNKDLRDFEHDFVEAQELEIQRLSEESERLEKLIAEANQNAMYNPLSAADQTIVDNYRKRNPKG